MLTRASSASTTGSPSVRFGTKWLSITSTCSQSALPATRSHSRARSAKSAERMLGAIWMPTVASVAARAVGQLRRGRTWFLGDARADANRDSEQVSGTAPRGEELALRSREIKE